MFLPWLHEFQCLINLLLKPFSIVHELLFVVTIAESPIMFVSTDEWVVDVLYHIAKHSNWVGCDLSEEYLFVAGLVDVDLHKR